jgi:hypothetical protein
MKIIETMKNNLRWILPLGVVFLVVALWGTSGFLLIEMEDRGTFGDMFGAINALFSGLAFSGVVFAILLQRKELELQRKELELTRNELSGQKNEMELQNKTLLKQSFENTFFQLLRLQQEIVNSIDLRKSGNPSQVTTGRDCMHVFFNRFRNDWDKEKKSENKKLEIVLLNDCYLDFYQDVQQDIGHYFRSLYHIVKLVDRSDIPNKRLYTNLVRAQLSSYELTLLFYNCLSNLGKEKFKPLIEKYSLLKNMPTKLLLNTDEHLPFYNETAYK